MRHLALLVLAMALLTGCAELGINLNTTWWCTSGGALPDPEPRQSDGHRRLCSDEEVQMARENGWLH